MLVMVIQMINYEQAKSTFLNFIEKFNADDKTILFRKEHTLRVVENSEYLAYKLNLSEEDILLAKVIALLHDIGRFPQIAEFNNMRDYETLDHADLGVKLLFEDGYISEFIWDRQYDEIIKKAISFHNKYQFDTTNLTDREVLHAKIIRDSDKMDSFPNKITGDIYMISHVTKEEVESSLITDSIYECFMNKKTIISKDRKTPADIWISYLAFIFDFNFSVSLKWVKEHDYVNQLIDRFDYKEKDTKEKMENIRNFSLQYIDSRIQEGE